MVKRRRFRRFALRHEVALRHCTGTCLHSSYPLSVHIIAPPPCFIFRLLFFFLSLLSSLLLIPRYDLMGNFVSSSCSTSSRPTTTPPASPPSPPSPSYHKGRTTLTSALTAHATRFAHLFRDRIHLDDIEEGLTLPVDDTSTRGPHADADVLDGRRRALLIGIAYHGELLNTHKDVDRYRDLLLGTSHEPSLLCFTFFPHSFYCLAFFLLSHVSFVIVFCCTTGTYGYRAEDVVVLKDDPALPAHLQPTRENIVSFVPIPVSLSIV
jgi:hypothetical protein